MRNSAGEGTARNDKLGAMSDEGEATENNEGFLAADRKREFRPDEIGYWSEVKLDIVKEYAQAYSTIMHSQKQKKRVRWYAYIDAFSGAGIHISRTTGEFVRGSPLNALLVTPAFDHYYFIDTDSLKVGELKSATGRREDVDVLQGDCNQVLLADVFPHIRYEDYRRALCLLDPYGLHLSWNVIRTAGQMKTVDVFLNFPMMDMNMNVLWHHPELVDEKQAGRMTFYWGDETWKEVAYCDKPDLFESGLRAKVADANEAVAEAFRVRLRSVAGFANVPKPLAMRNRTGATVYYLFFASRKDVANHIVSDIFTKYAGRCKAAPGRG